MKLQVYRSTLFGVDEITERSQSADNSSPGKPMLGDKRQSDGTHEEMMNTSRTCDFDMILTCLHYQKETTALQLEFCLPCNSTTQLDVFPNISLAKTSLEPGI